MPNHRTSICYEWVSMSAANKGQTKEALPRMRWQACMLPRELIWEGMAPLNNRNDTVCKGGLAAKQL